MSEWTKSTDLMPAHGQDVAIAQKFHANGNEWVWIFRTGMRSEMYDTYEDCWFDDGADEMVQLENTWWSPISPPFEMNEVTGELMP